MKDYIEETDQCTSCGAPSHTGDHLSGCERAVDGGESPVSETVSGTVESNEMSPTPGYTLPLKELMEMFNPFIGSNGDIDKNLFDQAPAELMERMEGVHETLMESIETGDPADFLSSDALKSIPASLKVELAEDVLRHIAKEDSDRAFLEYVRAVKSGVLTEKLNEAALQEKRRKFDDEFIFMQLEMVRTIGKTDPVGAANRLLWLKQNHSSRDQKGWINFKEREVESIVSDEAYRIEQAGGV